MKEPLLYKIVRPIINFLFKVIYQPTIIGKENIPINGPIVLSGNHTNNLDCLLIISSTKRIVHFLAKDSLYKGLKKPIFKGMGIIPVDRTIHDKGALNSAINALKEGKTIGIFPEGTINRTDDTIMPFKIGCVKMSHDTNTPIVPFVITGEYKILKKSVRIEFFKPFIANDEILDNDNNKLMNIIKTELEKRR